MKCILLFIIGICSFYLAKSQVKKLDEFIINGNLVGHNTKDIKISYFNKSQVWVDDTAKVNNGSFSFRGSIAEPTLVRMYGNIKSRSVDDPNFTQLFIEPKVTTINLTENNFKRAIIKSSNSQMLLNELMNSKKHVEESSESIGNSYSLVKEAFAQGDTSKVITDRMEDFRLQLVPFQDKLKNIDLKFVRSHGNEYISSYILGFYSKKISHDSLQFYYNLLSASVKNNRYGQYVYKDLMPNKKPTAIIGSIAPNIYMRDINAKWVSLKSFRSKKYILLDFWASWCIPCLRMNTHLQKTYKTYKDKGLEIISLSLDHNKSDWENAIKNGQLNAWINILVGQNGKAADYIMDKYDLTTVPTYILIDKNGIILGRYDVIDENSNLDKKFHEIFY